jgi:hypothetical protein
MIKVILFSALTIATLFFTHAAKAADTYEITVTRGKDTTGKISCPAAGVSDVVCYWKKEKRIPANTYLGCSTTIMASKGYKAVFIPDVPGFEGIFIHQGSGPNASDGCIVTAKETVEKIWNAIPRDQKNIDVKVVDE